MIFRSSFSRLTLFSLSERHDVARSGEADAVVRVTLNPALNWSARVDTTMAIGYEALSVRHFTKGRRLGAKQNKACAHADHRLLRNATTKRLLKYYVYLSLE